MLLDHLQAKWAAQREVTRLKSINADLLAVCQMIQKYHQDHTPGPKAWPPKYIDFSNSLEYCQILNAVDGVIARALETGEG